MTVCRRVDGVGRLDDSMYTPPEWSVVALLPDFGRVLSRVPLVLESTALRSSSRELGQKKGKKTQSSSCTTSSGNENVPGPVKTASSSRKGLTSQGL